jgi:hypothetical protein
MSDQRPRKTRERPMQADAPHSEPEIIPPAQARRGRARGEPRTRIFVDSGGVERVYVARTSPLGFILFVLITAVLSAVMLALLLGALMFVLPLLVLFVAGAIVVAIARAYFSRSP